jgi:FkbM family methyltransferase
MKMRFVEDCNTKALESVEGFRNLVGIKSPNTYDLDFAAYRFNNPYFGYVEVENDSCFPFYMFSNNDDLVAQHYFWYGRNGYERASVREWTARAKKASVVYDVGSHTGLFSMLACRSNPSLNNVVAFEPTSRAHSRIMENLIVNALVDKVKVEQKAISDGEGTLSLMHYEDAYQIGTGASLLGTEKSMPVTRNEICHTISLDGYVRESGLVPDLMKVDVEGAEILALRGAQELISQGRTTILIEVLPSTVADVAALLPCYTLMIVDDEQNGLVPYQRELVSSYTNLLAVPPARGE